MVLNTLRVAFKLEVDIDIPMTRILPLLFDKGTACLGDTDCDIMDSSAILIDTEIGIELDTILGLLFYFDNTP